MNVICPRCGESPVLDDYDYCESCLLSNARADDAWREHMVPTSPTTAHKYVRWEGTRWRTCQVCGRGANATIHRPTSPYLPPPIQPPPNGVFR